MKTCFSLAQETFFQKAAPPFGFLRLTVPRFAITIARLDLCGMPGTRPEERAGQPVCFLMVLTYFLGFAGDFLLFALLKRYLRFMFYIFSGFLEQIQVLFYCFLVNCDVGSQLSFLLRVTKHIQKSPKTFAI